MMMPHAMKYHHGVQPYRCALAPLYIRHRLEIVALAPVLLAHAHPGRHVEILAFDDGLVGAFEAGDLILMKIEGGLQHGIG